MKYSQAKRGRVFVLRLEDGDILHEVIENFAKENHIQAATLTALGAIDKESVLIVGPKEDRSSPIVPIKQTINDVYEVTGTGTIFPDSQNNPILHMHLSCGSGDHTLTGCVRSGVKIWHVLEVVIYELLETTGKRIMEPSTGFAFLVP